MMIRWSATWAAYPEHSLRVQAVDRLVEHHDLPFPGIGERGVEQGERGGCEQGAEQALKGTPGDQHLEVLGGASQGGGGCEAGQEDPLSPTRSARRPPSRSRLPKARE
jgi:hypothetical protein